MGGDRHAQAAVSLGKGLRAQLDDYGEKKNLLHHRSSKTESSSPLEIWQALMMHICFLFFSRKGGGEEFIDQQPEYQLLHEDTVRHI